MPFASVIGLLLRRSPLSYHCLQKVVSSISLPDEDWGWPRLTEIAVPTPMTTVPYHTLKAGGSVGAP